MHEGFDSAQARGPIDSYDAYDDAELMEKVMRHDDQAFEAVMRRNLPMLRRFLLRFIRDRNAIDDICQDTFLKFLESIDSLQSGRSLHSYLRTIAHHRLIDMWRRNAKAPFLATDVTHYGADGVRIDPVEQAAVCMDNPLDRLVRWETNERLDAAVNRMRSAANRAAIAAVYLKQVPRRTAAEELRILPATLKSRVANGVHDLRTRLSSDDWL